MIGQSVKRREDDRILAGQGRFIDDINLYGQTHAFIVRSPYAHARIVAIDTQAAREAPGVVAVFTGADLAAEGVGGLRYPVSIKNHDGTPVMAPARPALAVEKVRHVGESVAVVIAETRAQAQDAAELVAIEYEPLATLLDPEDAIRDDAVRIWDNAARNTSYVWEGGNRAATEQAMARAHHICRLRLVHNRIVAASMEPRGAIGVYDASQDRYILHGAVQDPQFTHSVLSEHALRIDGARLRVLVGDVGGGFGMKNFAYPEYAAVLWAARKVGRPVKWFADRAESFISDEQGRGHVTEAALALDQDGKFLAIDMGFVSNLGAYLTTSGSRISTIVGSRCVTGAYAIPAAHVETRGVFTNAVPSGSYRGAGKPEFIYVVERLVDAAARELAIDPVELRRRNLIPAASMPYRNAIGDTIDHGDFARNMDLAMSQAGWTGFERRRSEAKAKGRLRGIGLSVFVEHDGRRDGRARITFDGTGAVVVAVSAQSNGQGHETTFAQIAAARLGLPVERVKVLQGDTDRTGFGGGTGGSRSVTVCGGAIVLAADKIIAKGKRIAAAMFQARADDIDFADGLFRVRGTNKSVDISGVARTSYSVQAMPREEELGLEATGHYGGHVANFSNGCHVCEVEIDRDTGMVRIANYTAVHDFGKLVNPMLVEGQVHGGIAQGIAQALWENCVYDAASGQLLTGSLMDYCLPRAEDFPRFDCATTETPCTTNPLGVKGCGETGTTGAPPAVMNAILDALREFGVQHVDMPATPEQIWRACQSA